MPEVRRPDRLAAPPGGLPPAGASGLPWENRAQLGFGPALMQSIKLFINAPRDAYDAALRKGDYGSPALWVLIFAFVAALVQWVWSMALAGPMTAFMTAMMPDSARGEFAATMAAAMGFAGIAGLVKTILFPFFALIGAFVLAAIYHLALIVAGGGRDSESGFEGTFRAFSYSSITQIAAIIPFIGGLIAAVWWIVLLVIGMSSMHRMSTGKAVVVVLIPLFLCCACVSIAIALGAMASLAGHR